MVLESLIMFFFLHGRCEKNQESTRTFIILSHSDPTVLMYPREKIRKKALNCSKRPFLAYGAVGPARWKRTEV